MRFPSGSVITKVRPNTSSWGSSTTVTPLAGQDARVTITVGYDELAGVRQLLQFGDHIDILSPEAARGLIHDLAAQIVLAHR